MFHTNKVMAALAAMMIISSVSVLAAEPAKAPSIMPRVTQTQGMKAAEREFANQETMALLWMRSSAEYRELCYQAYNTAMTQVDKAVADAAVKKTGKPLAIVLDCDETVVDNMKGMAESALKGNANFSGSWWIRWCSEARAGAMPGAAEFLNGVHDKGVSIFYVTNRFNSKSYDATARNLKALHFPSVDREHLLLFTNTGNKQPRFDTITANYNVIIYMGDDANDLPLGTNGKPVSERNAIIDAHKGDFGTKYIVFPNPVYGNWIYAMDKHYRALSPTDRTAVNKKLLLQ